MIRINDILNQCCTAAKHIAALSGAEYFAVDGQSRHIINVDTHTFCGSCTRTGCDKTLTHLYGSSEAYRWNGKYIYYCPLGLVFTAAAVSDETGCFAGGIVIGPVIMGEPSDTLDAVSDDSLKQRTRLLPVFSTENVTHLSESLAIVTAYCAGLPHSKAGAFIYEQDKLLKIVASLHVDHTYPLAYEKRLRKHIIEHDRNGALDLLNELLGHLYFSYEYNLDAVKTRTLELVVVLSRASIDAGADANEIFLLSEGYIKALEQFRDVEELSVWLTGILYRFTDCVFNFKSVKRLDLVQKIKAYVRANCEHKLTLDDIGRHVFLSRSYLSSMFKEQTGQSLVGFINEARVEKCKQLLTGSDLCLTEVAGRCGFDDQSYFTKVFKKYTGVSPYAYKKTGNRKAGR